MKIAPLADVKAKLSAYVDTSEKEGPVIITRNGKPVAVRPAERKRFRHHHVFEDTSYFYLDALGFQVGDLGEIQGVDQFAVYPQTNILKDRVVPPRLQLPQGTPQVVRPSSIIHP